MPTEENKNVQVGGDSNTGSQSNVVDNDIDLNLDGLDIPQKETSSVEGNSVDSGDDWLAEEDKRVEELQQSKEEGLGSEQDKNSENKENLGENSDIQYTNPEKELENLMLEPLGTEGNSDGKKDLEERPTQAKEESILDKEKKLDNLDISEETNNGLKESNNEGIGDKNINNEEFSGKELDNDSLGQIEELNPIFDDSGVAGSEVESKVVEEAPVEGQTNLDNLNSEKTREFSENKENVLEQSHVENLSENVMEDKQANSSVYDVNNNKNEYVPNIHDFEKVKEVIDKTDKGGAIDLGALEVNNENTKVNNDNTKELKTGVYKESKSEGELNLDKMIADLGDTGDTNGLDIENDKIEPIVEETKSLESNKMEATDQVSQADLGVGSEIVTTPGVIETKETVVTPNALHKKKRYIGLKIFLFVVVLFSGLIFVLSKMYPEEVKSIVNLIKGETVVVVEYSDNSSDETVLEDVQNMNADLTGDVGEVEEDEDLDSNSLAGQLENTDSDTDVANTIEYTGDNTNTGVVFNVSGHSSSLTGSEFNTFEGLEEVMESESGDDLLSLLYSYKSQGEEYNMWGRSINNTTAMKYGSYISKKAGDAINSIENGEEIDNTKLDFYFAQFDKYLDKLSKLRSSIESETQSGSLVSSGTYEQSDEQSETSTGTIQ